MLALQCGGVLSDIDAACRALKPIAGGPEDQTLPQWQQSWEQLSKNVEAIAETDLQRGFRLSAGSKFRRAAAYGLMSERMMRGYDAARADAYTRARDLVRKSIELSGDPVEHVEVPFEGSSLPGLLYKAKGAGRRPCLIFFSGFDVSKEYLFLFGIGPELSARGISVLFIDHPGVGEALRLRGLHAFPETERATTPCVDYLQTRRDIDPDRIGVIGVSLGGYYAARSAAFEKRLAACICWGGQWDYGAVTLARARVEVDLGERRQIAGVEARICGPGLQRRELADQVPAAGSRRVVAGIGVGQREAGHQVPGGVAADLRGGPLPAADGLSRRRLPVVQAEGTQHAFGVQEQQV